MELTERQQAALEQAMYQFWSRGVDDTSYNVLVEATGMSRKALYATWPEKELLVRQTMKLYRDTVLSSLTDVLANPSQDAVRAFWDVAEAAAVPGWPGCYLLRSATGELRKDPEIVAMYDEFVQTIRKGIAESVRRRVNDPDVTATQAVALLNFLTDLASQQAPESALRPVLNAGRAACAVQ